MVNKNTKAGFSCILRARVTPYSLIKDRLVTNYYTPRLPFVSSQVYDTVSDVLFLCFFSRIFLKTLRLCRLMSTTSPVR